MDLIERALQVASIAHERQYRKGTNIPYITHPVAVGMLLMKAGYRDEVVAAGILHDTIEDTNLTIEQLEEAFGKEVAHIVKGCSEPDKSLPWQERKEHTISYLKTAPLEIRAVACADKLHNVRSIITDLKEEGESLWKRFNAPKHQQAWYYHQLVESLSEQPEIPLLDELAEAVHTLFPK